MRCRYTTMKLISTILLASTAAALKQRAAPTKALQVRGGGMVEKSTALTVTKVVFGLYGAQMLLVPDFVMTQNVQACVEINESCCIASTAWGR